MKLTNNRGLDTAIEVVGVVATFELCEAIVAAGVHLVTIGVHGKSVTLQMEKIWSHNITITTRLVDTVTTPIIIKTVQAKKNQPEKLITQQFKLDEIMQAYETFGNASEEKSIESNTLCLSK